LQRGANCGFIRLSHEPKLSPTGDNYTEEADVKDTDTTGEDTATKGDNPEVVAAKPQKPVVAVRRSKTPDEKKRRLAELESGIRSNMRVISTRLYEVAAYLSEIDEDKLYKHTTTHRNFNEYCEATFGFTRQHAYRLIDAAQVVDLAKEIAPSVEIQNESQARPLTKLLKDPERFKEAVQVIARSDKSLTTRAVQTAVDQVTDAPAPGESSQQKTLRMRLPEEVKWMRWESGTIAVIRLDLARYIDRLSPGPAND
jgi:hypothetical protein